MMRFASEESHQRYTEAAAEQYEFINFHPVNDRVLSIGYEQPPDDWNTARPASSANHTDRGRSKNVRYAPHMSNVKSAGSLLGDRFRFFTAAILFLRDHNPFTLIGRARIRNFALRSGPAYQVPKSLRSNDTGGRFTGWRMGAVLNICLLVSCLVLEITILITATTTDKRNSISESENTIYKGNCATAKRWATILSVFLNIIATTTIGCSNYIMQCLSAPSSSEIRLAHKNGRSLQVGVSSPTNIVYMSRSKTILWWMMGLSSIPVHLLFNSAFYSSLQTNNYAMALVTSDFEDNTLWTSCSSRNVTELPQDSWSRLVCGMKENSTDSLWESITNEECIERYSDPLISKYSNVLVISSIKSTDRVDRWEVTAPDMTLSCNVTPSFDSILGYTVGNNWQNWTFIPQNYSSFNSNYSSIVEESLFEAPLLDMLAFFGVFMSFSYSTWDEQYRYQHYDIDDDTYPLYDTNRWLCHDNYTESCTRDAALGNSTNWVVTPDAIPIRGCLSQHTPGEHFQLLYSTTIIIIVIGCDLIKILVVVLALRLDEQPCVTIGDVITSFLDAPESYTEKRCLVDRERAMLESDLLWFLPTDFSPAVGEETVAAIWSQYFGPSTAKWLPRSRRWFHAPSMKRWIAFSLLLLPILFVAGRLLYYGILNLDAFRGVTMWTKGLTTVDPNAVYISTILWSDSPKAGFVQQVMLVNSPQLLLSYLYILYNGLLTTMHASYEWTDFATERKTLRVSNPRPGQRSTYWLSLPWKYSLPLIAVSALLHWMVSRSLYLVQVNVIGPTGLSMPDETIAACGYSILMILLVIAVLIIMVATLFGFSMRRLDSSNIPIIGTSSVAISAVCHHPNDVETEACKPLLWGVTELPKDGQPGHCALSSGPVSNPEIGKEYW